MYVNWLVKVAGMRMLPVKEVPQLLGYCLHPCPLSEGYQFTSVMHCPQLVTALIDFEFATMKVLQRWKIYGVISFSVISASVIVCRGCCDSLPIRPDFE